MAPWRKVADKNERETASTVGLNIQTTGFAWQNRSSSSMDARPPLSNHRGAEQSNGNCHREAQDVDAVLFDDGPDGNVFDFYVGVASAIGLLLVLIVAFITAASLWLLIQR
jgi:hypothetical protein